MERHSHDSVGSIERFLNTVAVVNVNVDVQNPLLESKELNDAKDDIYRPLISTYHIAKLLTYR